MGGAERVEAIDKGDPDVDFGGLAIWIPRGDALTEGLQASHLGRTGDLSGTSPAQTAASLQLRFELPIGPTGGNEARRRQKEFEQSAAGYDLAAASQGVFAGVDAALERLDLVRQSLALARKAARHAVDVAQGMATERLLGDRTVFDEIGAINGVAEADMAAANMAYELTVAEHLLAAQTGQIAAIYGVHISGNAAN